MTKELLPDDEKGGNEKKSPFPFSPHSFYFPFWDGFRPGNPPRNFNREGGIELSRKGGRLRHFEEHTLTHAPVSSWKTMTRKKPKRERGARRPRLVHASLESCLLGRERKLQQDTHIFLRPRRKTFSLATTLPSRFVRRQNASPWHNLHKSAISSPAKVSARRSPLAEKRGDANKKPILHATRELDRSPPIKSTANIRSPFLSLQESLPCGISLWSSRQAPLLFLARRSSVSFDNLFFLLVPFWLHCNRSIEKTAQRKIDFNLFMPTFGLSWTLYLWNST